MKGTTGQLRLIDELAFAPGSPALPKNVIKPAYEALDLLMNPTPHPERLASSLMNLAQQAGRPLKAGTLTTTHFLAKLRQQRLYHPWEAEHAAKEARKAERKAAAEAKRPERQP